MHSFAFSFASFASICTETWLLIIKRERTHEQEMQSSKRSSALTWNVIFHLSVIRKTGRLEQGWKLKKGASVGLIFAQRSHLSSLWANSRGTWIDKKGTRANQKGTWADQRDTGGAHVPLRCDIWAKIKYLTVHLLYDIWHIYGTYITYDISWTNKDFLKKGHAHPCEPKCTKHPK